MSGQVIRSRDITLAVLVTGLNGLRAGRFDETHPQRALWETIERIMMALVPERVPRKGRSILGDWMAAPWRPLPGETAKKDPLEEARSRFHWLSRQYPVQLTLAFKQTPHGLQPVTGFRCHESKPNAALEVGHLDMLWQFFAEGGYKKLGTCRVCGSWFVNHGRNRTKASCNKQCTNKFWSRPQRRKSVQAQSSAKREARERELAHKKTQDQHTREVKRRIEKKVKSVQA